MSIADELITRGWTKHHFEAPDGSVCLRGAKSCAFYGQSTVPVGVSLLPRSILARSIRANLILSNLVAERGFDCVTRFNDAPETTYDDVLRVAKEADELLEAS